jgi:nicotinate-nucleotide pyrophosphorylase (carboxylating)
MFSISYDDIIIKALTEDIGTGDITTIATVPEDKKISGRFIAKESGVICGMDVVKRTFELLDKNIVVNVLIPDGQAVECGDIIAEVEGLASGILTGERTALNFLQHMSGIATKTAEIAKSLEGTNARICDTRKTIPGLRMLAKYAVKVGGGANHRFNLSDGILIKDNHISAAGSITAAVNAARINAPHMLKVEVEVENFEQLEEALNVGADVIMLDNMSIDDMREAVKIVNGRAITEASGNMGDRKLSEVAATGVDLISMGALTHTVRALDISLRFN